MFKLNTISVLLGHFRGTVDPKVLLRVALGITYLQQSTVTEPW